MVPLEAPYDAKSAQHDQNKTTSLLQRECFLQNHCCQDRDHQWHDTWKQCTPMGSRCEKQAGIHKQHHGRPAADHYGGKSRPPKAIERQPSSEQVRQ